MSEINNSTGSGAPRPQSPAPRRQQLPAPRGRRVLTRILVAVAALLVVALGAGAAYVYSINRSVTNNLTRSDVLPGSSPSDPASTTRPSREPQATGALNYVLLGSDSRDADNSDNGRSDSIMVVHLNAARTKAYIVSFPRDMYVAIPGHGRNKINAAFSFGGAKLAVATLENLLGVRMDHVALIDFEGFVQLTDDIGGVTVTNKHAFSSHGFTYPKGKITIKGKQALWFVRERHALPGGDLDRAQNQRNVIKAIVEKGVSPSTMADPVKYLKFISGVAQHVTVDSTLSDAEIRSTALSIKLTGKDIVSVQAPISGYGTVNGASIDVVDKAKMAKLSKALRDDKVASYLKRYPQS
jgi:LCP family protein required for cell wall assembly